VLRVANEGWSIYEGLCHRIGSGGLTPHIGSRCPVCDPD
jgi:hypothetical protein